jgi:hypothetical protein
MKENKDQDTPKNSNQISYSIGFRKGKEKTINRACEVFAEMLIELYPELLGYGAIFKGWEDEFRDKLVNKLKYE